MHVVLHRKNLYILLFILFPALTSCFSFAGPVSWVWIACSGQGGGNIIIHLSDSTEGPGSITDAKISPASLEGKSALTGRHKKIDFRLPVVLTASYPCAKPDSPAEKVIAISCTQRDLVYGERDPCTLQSHASSELIDISTAFFYCDQHNLQERKQLVLVFVVENEKPELAIISCNINSLNPDDPDLDIFDYIPEDYEIPHYPETHNTLIMRDKTGQLYVKSQQEKPSRQANLIGYLCPDPSVAAGFSFHPMAELNITPEYSRKEHINLLDECQLTAVVSSDSDVNQELPLSSSSSQTKIVAASSTLSLLVAFSSPSAKLIRTRKAPQPCTTATEWLKNKGYSDFSSEACEKVERKEFKKAIAILNRRKTAAQQTGKKEQKAVYQLQSMACRIDEDHVDIALRTYNDLTKDNELFKPDGKMHAVVQEMHDLYLKAHIRSKGPSSNATPRTKAK